MPQPDLVSEDSHDRSSRSWLRFFDCRLMARERLRRDLPLDQWWTLRVAAWYALLFSVSAISLSTVLLAEIDRSVEVVERGFAIYMVEQIRVMLHPMMALVMAFHFIVFFLMFWMFVFSWRHDMLRRALRCVRCCYPLAHEAIRCHECGRIVKHRSK